MGLYQNWKTLNETSLPLGVSAPHAIGSFSLDEEGKVAKKGKCNACGKKSKKMHDEEKFEKNKFNDEDAEEFDDEEFDADDEDGDEDEGDEDGDEEGDEDEGDEDGDEEGDEDEGDEDGDEEGDDEGDEDFEDDKNKFKFMKSKKMKACSKKKMKNEQVLEQLYQKQEEQKFWEDLATYKQPEFYDEENYDYRGFRRKKVKNEDLLLEPQNANSEFEEDAPDVLDGFTEDYKVLKKYLGETKAKAAIAKKKK